MQKDISELRDQSKFFDALIVNSWESYNDKNWDRSRDFEVKQIINRIDSTRINKAIDIGCGCGYHDVKFANLLPNLREMHGIDCSKESVEIANRVYPHNKVRRYVAKIEDLKSREFDLIVSFQVIEHLEEPLHFMEKAFELLNPGGFCVIATPNYHRLYNRMLTFFNREKQLCDPYHFREFTIKDMKEMGLKVGFKVYSSFGYGMSFVIPKVNKQVIPRSIGRRLGYYFKPLSDVICVIYRK